MLSSTQIRIYLMFMTIMAFRSLNNQDFFNSINNFIDQHNTFYTESISHKNPADIISMDTVIIPADPAGRYGELKFFDFVKQTIQNTYVPLTEIPIIYQHIKTGTYQPKPKSQVIRDRNGILLNPTSPEFDHGSYDESFRYKSS